MVIYLLLLVRLVYSTIDLLVFFGGNTEQALINYFESNLTSIIDNQYDFEIKFELVNDATDFSALFRSEVTIAVDALFDVSLSQILLSYTEENQFLNLFLDPNLEASGS